MVEHYEIMLIVRPELEKDEHEEILSGLKSTIGKKEGTVSTILDWRKRRLAYEIDKLQEGHYYLVYFKGPGTIIPEIEHYFRVTDAVIRYMVVRTDEHEFAVAAEKAASEAAAAEKAAEAAETTEVSETAETVEAAETTETEEQETEEQETEEQETEEQETEEQNTEETAFESAKPEEKAGEEKLDE